MSQRKKERKKGVTKPELKFWGRTKKGKGKEFVKARRRKGMKEK